MIRRPPRSTLDRSSAASDVYKRQEYYRQTYADRHLSFDMRYGEAEVNITIGPASKTFVVSSLQMVIILTLSLIHISEPTRPY